jgi:hypothetical protein
MTCRRQIRHLVAFALALALLVSGPGCGGGGGWPAGLGGNIDFGPPAPPIVGHVTGTWQGSAADAFNGQPPSSAWIASPAGPLTLVIAHDGKFSGTLHDTATGEVIALTGTILNYGIGVYGVDPKKRAGFPAPGATLTFKGHSYDLSGTFVLEPNGRLTGSLALTRIITGSDGHPANESAQFVFTLVKQE